MTANLATAAIRATGGSASRGLGTRYADVINVKDYGAVGDFTTDDSAAIQAAIDAAFGTAASPHAVTNAHLNKVLFFPNGTYGVRSTLVLTQVYGGLVAGCGGGTYVIYTGPTTTDPVLRTNGFEQSRIENISFGSSGAGSICVDLDWDGTGSVGLNSNVFWSMTTGSSATGIRLANSGNDGARNTFFHVYCQSHGTVGLKVVGSNAKNNMLFFQSGSDSTIGVHVAGGSISVAIAGSLGGLANTDYKIDTTEHIYFAGTRTESVHFLDAEGDVTIAGMDTASMVDFLNLTGTGKVIIDGAWGNRTISGTSDCPAIVGDGTLYVRNIFDYDLSGFSGTTPQYITGGTS